MIGTVAGFVVWVYLMVLTARAVLSVIPLLIRGWQPRGVLLVVAELVHTLTDPPLRWLRRVLPTVKVGGVQWDLAFVVLFLGLWVAMRVLPVLL